MEIDMILWLWYAALIAVSFGAGWLSRFVFVQCNQYRMSKRLIAFHRDYMKFEQARDKVSQ